MSRFVVRLLVAGLLCGAAPAFAQGPGAGRLEFTIVPGGWVSFPVSDSGSEPAFGQYLFGGSFTVNWGMVGVEGDLLMGLGRSQSLDFGATSVTEKTPHVVLDSVSLVVPLGGNRRTVVPYVDAGIGEATVMRSRDVGQADTETFTTGSFGGGVKWYANGRWSFRGDYRFSVMRSKFDAPGSFIGRELRHIHRVYGAIVVTLIPLAP